MQAHTRVGRRRVHGNACYAHASAHATVEPAVSELPSPAVTHADIMENCVTNYVYFLRLDRVAVRRAGIVAHNAERHNMAASTPFSQGTPVILKPPAFETCGRLDKEAAEEVRRLARARTTRSPVQQAVDSDCMCRATPAPLATR